MPALDGLRGIAILLVLLHHAYGGLTPTRPSWNFFSEVFFLGRSGVDLFFVLSGFLITRNLLLRGGTFGGRLGEFWRRRSIRIFPLYYGFLVVWSLKTVLRGHEILPWPFWTYTCNWWLGYHPEYSTGPLAHFWSLSVEEQFYLVWPLVVLTAGSRASFVACAGFLLAPAFRCAVLFGGDVAEHTPRFALAYFATPSRMDALCVGALLAFVVFRGGAVLERSMRLRAPLMIVSAVVLAAVYAIQGSFDLHPLAAACEFSAFAVFYGSAVSFAVVPGESAFARRLGSALEAPWLRALGTLSYSAYVFNFPIAKATASLVAKAQEGRSDLQAFLIVAVLGAIGAVCSVAVGWLSYRYYESRFLKLKEAEKLPPSVRPQALTSG